MVAWLAARVPSTVIWRHAYSIRRTGRDWTCDSLFSAFEQYEWDSEQWGKTRDRLRRFRDAIRVAALRGDAPAARAACEDVLRWGGVWAGNGKYLNALGDRLLDELAQMSRVLEADATPASDEALLIHGRVARMNAGFVKIYSVLVDHCVIYDGRVGAALGLLVRQFCEEQGRTTIPPVLSFAYGVPKEAQSQERPKRRNPSSGALVFPQLRAGASRFHVDNTMRANWLLSAVLDRERGSFSPGEAGFHELAAALFMVGYDLTTALGPEG